MESALPGAGKLCAGSARQCRRYLFAFAAIPVIGLLGGAVDVTRHNRYKTTLAECDGRGGDRAGAPAAPKNDAEADAFVNDFIAGHAAVAERRTRCCICRLRRDRDRGRLPGRGERHMDTAFLPVVGMRDDAARPATEVVMSGGKYEVALALDNTGSMAELRPHRGAARRRRAAGRRPLHRGGRGGAREDGARPVRDGRQYRRRRASSTVILDRSRRRRSGVSPQTFQRAASTGSTSSTTWASSGRAAWKRAEDDLDDTTADQRRRPLGALSLAGRAGRRLRQRLSAMTAAPATTGTACATSRNTR